MTRRHPTLTLAALPALAYGLALMTGWALAPCCVLATLAVGAYAMNEAQR